MTKYIPLLDSNTIETTTSTTPTSSFISTLRSTYPGNSISPYQSSTEIAYGGNGVNNVNEPDGAFPVEDHYEDFSGGVGRDNSYAPEIPDDVYSSSDSDVTGPDAVGEIWNTADVDGNDPMYESGNVRQPVDRTVIQDARDSVKVVGSNTIKTNNLIVGSGDSDPAGEGKGGTVSTKSDTVNGKGGGKSLQRDPTDVVVIAPDVRLPGAVDTSPGGAVQGGGDEDVDTGELRTLLVLLYQYLPSATIVALNVLVPVCFKWVHLERKCLFLD